MTGKNELSDWIKSTCPTLWSLLKTQAQASIPPGCYEYLSPSPEEWILPRIKDSEDPEAEQYFRRIAMSHAKWGRRYLRVADQHLQDLIDVRGFKPVADAYRRGLSGVSTATQLAELFCEIATCSAFSKRSQALSLRPKNEKGTACDFHCLLMGVDVFGEIKRYDDNWLLGTEPPQRSIRSRLLTRPISGSLPPDTKCPRYMDLESKLLDVPQQFPDRTLNIVFIIHSSFEDNDRIFRQALFGEHSTFSGPVNNDLSAEEGLFLREDWRNVSACCSLKLEDGQVVYSVSWDNPRAHVPVPEEVRSVLKSLGGFPSPT